VRQLEAAVSLGAPVVELHTGAYAHAVIDGDEARTDALLARLVEAAALGSDMGLEVHAGHGLTFENVAPVAAIDGLAELNIGHFLVGEAIFSGLDSAVRRMRALMDQARQAGRAA
jgi:pyridoxine 5-phosphate synthase